MRPQHDAAENGPERVSMSSVSAASMRPQHDAAENLCILKMGGIGMLSFNEAAA